MDNLKDPKEAKLRKYLALGAGTYLATGAGIGAYAQSLIQSGIDPRGLDWIVSFLSGAVCGVAPLVLDQYDHSQGKKGGIECDNIAKLVQMAYFSYMGFMAGFITSNGLGRTGYQIYHFITN